MFGWDEKDMTAANGAAKDGRRAMLAIIIAAIPTAIGIGIVCLLLLKRH